MIDLLNRLKLSASQDDIGKPKKYANEVSPKAKSDTLVLLEIESDIAVERIAKVVGRSRDYIAKTMVQLIKEDKVIRRKNPVKPSSFIYKFKEV